MESKCAKGCSIHGIGEPIFYISMRFHIIPTESTEFANPKCSKHSCLQVLSTEFLLLKSLLFTLGSLRPSTQKILALAAEVKTLQNNKEHLRINLTRAEEEVSNICLLIFFDFIFN